MGLASGFEVYMDILRKATAGTGESSDALVSVSSADTLEIEITSVVYNQYAQAIESAVRQTLSELGVERGKVCVNDRGAIDCVIQARVETAVRRAGVGAGAGAGGACGSCGSCGAAGADKGAKA